MNRKCNCAYKLSVTNFHTNQAKCAEKISKYGNIKSKNK